MAEQWHAWLGGAPPDGHARALRDAHERFLADGEVDGSVRPVVAASWRRSQQSGVSAEEGLAPLPEDESWREERDSHPLAAVMPVVRRLLVEDARDTGLLVAISDAEGRLLWVEGHEDLRRRATQMNFVEGSRWGERDAGTSAPGIALAVDHAVQVFAGEHFVRVVQPWSCVAAPIHDPVSGRLLGALDVTGGDELGAPHTLPLVQSAVAAMEAELLLQGRSSGALEVAGPPRATFFGPTPTLTVGGATVRLSLRHAELLLLLSTNPRGLSLDELAVLLSERDPAPVTVRAEVSRLRRLLGPVLASKPYRLIEPLEDDLSDLRTLLAKGRVRQALQAYGGPLLPRSLSPGVAALRMDVVRDLKAALLSRPDAELLWAWAQDDGREDPDVWRAVAAVAAPGSPRRAIALSRLAALEAELGLG